MKNFTISMIVALVSIVLFTSNVNAQTTGYGTGYDTTQVIRITATPVTYTVNNPDGTNATFTWNVTGGTIVVGGVDQISPYIQVGSGATEFIQVRWDNTQDTIANIGSLRVLKTVSNGTITCSSADQTFEVQSWVAPSASSPTADFSVCGGTTVSTSVDLTFTGKSDYRYAWQLVRNSDNTPVASSAGEQTSATATTSVAVNYAVVAGETYTFRVTYMYDDFTDFSATTSGDVSTASVIITALATPVIGPVQSSDSLIER